MPCVPDDRLNLKQIACNKKTRKVSVAGYLSVSVTVSKAFNSEINTERMQNRAS